MGQRYVLVTPCRNEEDYLPSTIRTIGEQSVLPAKWVIVDDGSTDATPKILAEAVEKFPFIEVVGRGDRGDRSVGPGVVEAFYDGLSHVDLDEYDYVCKLDADLEMPPTYFEHLMKQFDADPLLGNKSGKVFLRINGELEHEFHGDENAIGAVKFYRMECFKDIGGFVREVSWDGIDGHMCRMKGWIASSEHEPETNIVHLRQMGSSHKNIWRGRLRWGKGKWYMGSAWYYVVAAGVFRMFERPYLLGGFGILTGYYKAMFTGVKRFSEPGFRKWLRRFELRALLAGKNKVLAEFNAEIRAGASRKSDVPTALGVSGAKTPVGD